MYVDETKYQTSHVTFCAASDLLWLGWHTILVSQVGLMIKTRGAWFSVTLTSSIPVESLCSLFSPFSYQDVFTYYREGGRSSTSCLIRLIKLPEDNTE